MKYASMNMAAKATSGNQASLVMLLPDILYMRVVESGLLGYCVEAVQRVICSASACGAGTGRSR